MQDKKISIIGLGLIGGSLAKAFRRYLQITDITAVNRTKKSIEDAVNDGIVSRGFTELNEYIYNSDIIFICTPIKKTKDYIFDLAKRVKPNTIITDVGSTKAEIVEFVDSIDADICFVGGHPMTGSEKTGYGAGFEHLFENAYYILTKCKNSNQDAIDLLVDMLKGIGAIPILMDSKDHDTITGAISHVPHIIASALVNVVNGLDDGKGMMKTLAAGGFRDITRIASSDPNMWENIILSNKEKIKGILEAYVECINKLKDNIDKNDSQEILDFFCSAKRYRDSFASNGKSLIIPIYELSVNIKDAPGIIGEIATLLGGSNINIKNINISNSREFEQGCLRIAFSDNDNLNKAYCLLKKSNYEVFINT